MDIIKIQVRKLNYKNKDFLVFLFFIFLSVFIFRDYFFKNLVPFPSNLLVANYQPWTTYKDPEFPNGPPNKPIGFDNLRIFYPYRKITTDEIKMGEVPLWNPYSFSGNTHLATYQSAIFHPLSFLFLIFPLIDAWSLIIIVGPILGLSFTYLYLKQIGFNRKSSIFGSVVFGLSSFSIVWWEESLMSYYSALFLPLSLFAIEKIYLRLGKINLLILILSLCFSVLSGWFQMSLYLYSVSFIYSVFLLFKTKKYKRFLVICFGFIFSILVSAIHLLPSFEALLYAPRGSTDARYLFESYLLKAKDLATFFVPDVFGNPGVYNYFGEGFYYEKVMFVGIPALLFVFFAFISPSKDSREKFFKFLFVLTMSLGFSLPTTWLILYHLNIPFISKIIPSRIFYLSTFSLAIISAYGVREYLNKFNIKKILIIIVFLVVIYLLIGAIVSFDLLRFVGIKNAILNISVSFKNIIFQIFILIVSSTIFIVGGIKRYRVFSLFALLGISILASLYMANKYLYFSQRKFVFPTTPVISKVKELSGINRVLSIGNGYIEKNLLSYYGIYSPEGYDSIYISRYGELVNSLSLKGKYDKEIPRADAQIPFLKSLSEYDNNVYRSRFLNLVGVRYFLLSSEESNTTKSFKKIWSDGKYNIYENLNSMSRVFIAKKYLVKKEQQSILNNIFNSKINLKDTVILEETPEIDDKIFKKGEIKKISYTPNKIEIQLYTDGSGFLFISDNYFPGWRAYINGVNSKIYRADYTFRSVVVPKGESKVVFIYDPLTFKIGAVVSFVSVLLLVILAFLNIKPIKFKLF